MGVPRAALLLTLLAVTGASAQDAPQRLDRQGDPLPEHAVARLGTSRLRHRGAVTAVAFAAGGERVVSIGDEKFVRVWDAASGREVARFEGTTTGFTALAVSRDHSRLAVGLGSGSVRLWKLDRDTGEATIESGFGAGRSAEGSADRRITSLAFGVDASTLAVGRGGGSVWIFEDGKTERTLARHTGAVSSLAFSGDGTLLATGSADHTVRLWNPHDGKHLLSMVGHAHGVIGVGFDAEGEHVAAGGEDGTLRVFARTNGVERASLQDVGGRADTSAVSPDGKLAAVGHRDGTINLWRIATRERLGRLTGHTGPVRCLAFRSDGAVLASGSEDRTVRLWDVARRVESIDLDRAAPTGAAPADGPPASDRVEALVFAPDSKTILTVAWDRTVRLWEGTTGKRVRAFPGPVRTGTASLLQVALGPHGDPIELWREGDFCFVREVTTGVRTFRHRLERADTALALTPDLSRLVVGARDGSIRLVTVSDGRLLRDFGKVATGPVVRLAAAQTHVAAIDEHGNAHVLALGSGKVTVPEFLAPSATALAVSSDGRWVAAAATDRAIVLAGPGGKARVLPGHEDAVRCLAFSPDGRHLASGADDSTVLVWRVRE